jgi:hypothetical protein
METKRIDLEAFDGERYPGGWADIKLGRPFAAGRKIESAGVKMFPKPGADLDNLKADDVELVYDQLSQGLATLEWHVIAWSLEDAGGNPLPVNRAGFLHEDFDDDLGAWLIDRINFHVEESRRSKRGMATTGSDT